MSFCFFPTMDPVVGTGLSPLGLSRVDQKYRQIEFDKLAEISSKKVPALNSHVLVVEH